MKLLRFGPAGQEKPGLLDPQGRIRSLEGVVPDIAGHVLTPEGLDALRRVDPATLPLVDEGVRLGPCVAGTGKFICIDRKSTRLNSSHANISYAVFCLKK